MDIQFDIPESVMRCDILDYLEVGLVDGIYEPPIALDTLAKASKANSIHGSALSAKRNMIASSTLFIEGSIQRRDYKRFIDDCLVFGNGYLLKVTNLLGGVTYKHLPALYMRRKKSLTEYCYKPRRDNDEGRIDYKPGQVFHYAEYDVCQEIYGLPQYIGALPSIWLNEEATLFRRKYYINGSHAGYILYLNDPTLSDTQVEDISKKLKKTGGLGAFKNIFINAKGKEGKKPELIPIGQIDAKDAFKDIKNQTTNDILTVHRIPLELMSVVREGLSSSGDLNKVDRIFYKNELAPYIESVVDELNAFAGKEIIAVKEYEGLETTKAA